QADPLHGNNGISLELFRIAGLRQVHCCGHDVNQVRWLLFEGGISSPFIAHWPEGIPAERRGKIEKQPAHLVDIMATAVDLAKASYPKEFKGNAIIPMQGVSLKPALKGKSLGRKKPLFWEHEGNKAVRDGKWKLTQKWRGDWELYDMEADRTESHNVIGEH